MEKFRNYTFYVGIISAILTVVSFVLDFFGVVEIMPIIIEVVAIISAVLVSLGIIKKDSKTQDIIAEKDELKEDLIDNMSRAQDDNAKASDNNDDDC